MQESEYNARSRRYARYAVAVEGVLETWLTLSLNKGCVVQRGRDEKQWFVSGKFGCHPAVCNKSARSCLVSAAPRRSFRRLDGVTCSRLGGNLGRSWAAIA